MKKKEKLNTDLSRKSKLTILPVIADDFLLTSAALSFNARPRIGTNNANEGASIECINSHSNKASNASFVLFAGSLNAANRIGLKRDTSGFLMTDDNNDNNNIKVIMSEMTIIVMIMKRQL